MRTREDLSGWVRDQISRAVMSSPHLVSRDEQAFMIHGTIGRVSYLTLDGEAYVEVDTWEPLPGTIRKWTGPEATRYAFFYGAKRYPELRDWLRERTFDDADCAACAGTGWRSSGQHSIGCDECGGFGWLIDIHHPNR